LGDFPWSKSFVRLVDPDAESYRSSLSLSPRSGSNLEYCEVSLEPGEGSSDFLLPDGKLRADVEVGFIDEDSGRVKPKLWYRLGIEDMVVRELRG